LRSGQLIHAIQALPFRRTLESSAFTLWLYQRHALKAFRASVGNEEGHKLVNYKKALLFKPLLIF